jgi:hypothetical protein
MAENRGGMRPTAPQNNPANVSGTGGAGQSGRVAQGYSYGINKQINEQAAAAPMAKAPQPRPVSASRMMSESPLPPVTPITAETMLPDEPITNGAPIGPGDNVVSNLPLGPSQDPDINMIRDYYPMLEFWASQPGTSQATKDYVQYLRTII